MVMSRWWTSFFKTGPVSTPRLRYWCNWSYCRLFSFSRFSIIIPFPFPEWIHSASSSCPARKHTHHQCFASVWGQAQRHYCGLYKLSESRCKLECKYRHLESTSCPQNGNTALGIARRLGYISVVDTLRVVTEEIITTTTVWHKHCRNLWVNLHLTNKRDVKRRKMTQGFQNL